MTRHSLSHRTASAISFGTTNTTIDGPVSILSIQDSFFGGYTEEIARSDSHSHHTFPQPASIDCALWQRARRSLRIFSSGHFFHDTGGVWSVALFDEASRECNHATRDFTVRGVTQVGLAISGRQERKWRDQVLFVPVRSTRYTWGEFVLMYLGRHARFARSRQTDCS